MITSVKRKGRSQLELDLDEKSRRDPVVLCQCAKYRRSEGDHDAAFKYFTEAAELGDFDAHYQLSCLYREGEGVEEDEKKILFHLKEAAIAGHPIARHNLACYEGRI